MRRSLQIVILAFSLMTGAASLYGHHSVYAEFDMTHPHNWSGVIAQVGWLNPHGLVYLDVKEDQNGKPKTWVLELPSPNTLDERGWSRDWLRTGESIVVDGNVAKDGSRKGLIRRIRLMDGRTIVALP
jgi:hypothetical protein